MAKLFAMYSLFAKKENAHEDSIWCVDWGRRKVKVPKEVEDENEGEERQPEEEERMVDVVATGGIDDLVKVIR